MSPLPSLGPFACARPVADAPVDALVARADELARRWASALVAARPLSELALLPWQDLAREAPALCAQLARALSSDEELERLLAPGEEPGRETRARSGPAGLGAWLAAASDVSSTVRGVEALRAIVWEAALGELREPTPRQIADLADRLSSISAALLASLLDRQPAGAWSTPGAVDAPGGGSIRYSSRSVSPGVRRAVLIDELNEATRPPAGARVAPLAGYAGAPPHEQPRPPLPTAPAERGRPAPTAPRPRPWDTPLGPESPAGGVSDPKPHAGAADATDAELRVTRGRDPRVDERAY
jgi:hypothetical protein